MPVRLNLFSTFLFLSFPAAFLGQTCENITATLTTGIWAEELTWGIIDEEGTEIYSSSTTYSDYSTYNEEVCLTPACYTVWMADSYGDGWQGGEITFYSESGSTIASGYVTAAQGDSAFLNLPLLPTCPIYGCTHPEGMNFDPAANTDDGSCYRGSDNMTLYSHWHAEDLPINGFGGSYSDVEGLKVNDREYAVIASTEGAHIIDVSAPDDAFEVMLLEGAYTGSGVTHRDYHIDGTFLYAVCDQGPSTLQIFDLSGLPNSVETVYDSNDLCITSHNVFGDNDSDLLYLCSTSNSSNTTSVRVLDVSNPYEPTEFVNLGPWIPDCHDIYVENDTAWVNSLSYGLYVMHISENPTMLGNLDEYSYAGTNHSGWWLSEEDIYVFADETHGSPLKVVETSDLSDLEVLATMHSGTDPSSSIPHNIMIEGDLVYVSYYHDGLRVFDISNPSDPVMVAWYDTFEQTSYSGYKGAWGVHSALPSGRILISDMIGGLFVITPNPEYVDVCTYEMDEWSGYSVVDHELWGTDIVWQIANFTDDACESCLGDLDENGSIGVTDFQLILAGYGCTADCSVDFNGDDTTDVDDLLFWLSLFGTEC